MRRTRLGVLCTAWILAVTLVASLASEQSATGPLARHLDAFPAVLGEWTSSSPPYALDAKVEEKLGATEYVSKTYRSRSRAVELFIAYYANQRAGESMHSPQNCLPGAGWEFWSRDVVDVTVGDAKVRVNRDSIQKDGTRAIVLYWYQTPKRIFADEYLGKLYLVWDSMTSGKANGSIVRLLVPDRPGAVEDGIALASLVIPEVQASFK